MKGQTSLEYVMTYGWAILVIVLVGGVMSYYGLFSPSGAFLAETARGFGQVQLLSPWSIDADNGDMQLYLQNRVGADIIITGAIVTIENGPTVTYTANKPISPGKSVMTLFTPDSWTAQELGAQYTAKVKIFYDYQGSTFDSSGTMSGKYS